MGKKERNRLTPKKKNNIPPEVIESKEIAHEKEFKADKRKPTN